MNKSNALKEQAGASTSLYNAEQTTSNSHQRSSSSGLSFLRWFKKNEKGSIDSRCSTQSVGRNFNKSTNHRNKSHNRNSHETLSPSSSPNFEYLSPSSSCDSVKSTSTIGFAFIKPNNYKPYNDITQRTIFTQEFEESASYRTLTKPKPDLTLRRKYCLYDADTLTSNEGDYDNLYFRDRSLPHLRNKNRDEQRILRNRRKFRRTASDNSKDKKSGAYVHVKGKRKAPPPPPLSNPLTNGRVSPEILSKSITTLNRKKRRAPPPPYSAAVSTNLTPSNGLAANMDIKALITSSSPGSRISDPQSEVVVMRHPTPFLNREPEDFTAAQKLTEQQKQVVLDNIVRVNQSTSSSETEIITPPPASPISPRPWYKRPISTHRDSSLPFKREVALKTMEKRKSKQKEKSSKAEKPVEQGHSRSHSLFDASSKLGFFLRGKDHSDKDKEKRRSAIGIPNISELDREAAEIVNREYASAQAAERSETEKFFGKPDHITLQQEMFGSKTNISIAKEECKEEEEGESEEAAKSTKELISKFEASANGPRITLNTSFIGRKENFVRQDSRDSVTKTNIVDTKEVVTNPTESTSSKDNTPKNEELNKKDSRENGDMNKKDKPHPESNVITRLSWKCAFCTLENPDWRIICEACERIKPYDKRTSIEDRVNQNAKPAVAIPTKEENLTDNLNSKMTKSDHSTNWDKKTEKVLKYFMPKTDNGNPLAKSSSETSVGKQQLFRKSPSPNNKFSAGSPQLGLRNRLAKIKVPENANKSSSIILEEKESLSPSVEKKKPLIDSSVIITTVTPVFYATTTWVKNPQVAILSDTNAKSTGDAHSEKVGSVEPELTKNQNIPDDTKEEPKVEDAVINGDPKINITEVRKARLAKFSVPQEPIVSAEPIPIYDHHSLEREKKRLRDMIQAMNAKALAVKYPVSTSNKNASPSIKEATPAPSIVSYNKKQSPPRDKDDTYPPEKSTASSNDQAKLGAIKKVFAKNRNSDSPKRSPDPAESSAKPKKVSTSVQTTRVVKKTLIADEIEVKPVANIYANMPIYENSPLEKFDKNVKLTENDRAKMQEISQQLSSVEGINDFRESLKNPLRGISATDTIALSRIMRNLETAIAEGQHELAAQIAIDLARMKVSLHVTKQKDRPVSRSEIDFQKNIIVDMFVEDKYSQKGPIQIALTPLLTISQLKQKIATDFDIPIDVQRWLINDDLAMDDQKSLLEFGVKDATATFYLYIVAANIHFYEAKKTNLDANRILPRKDFPRVDKMKIENLPAVKEESPDELGAVALVEPAAVNVEKDPSTDWACSLCTLLNAADRDSCLACTKPKPKDIVEKPQKVEDKPTSTVQLRPIEQRNDLNRASPNRKSTDVFNIVDIKIDIKKTIVDQMKPMTKGPSPNITRSNYRGVDNFNPNRKKGEAPKPPGVLVKPVPKSTEGPNKNHYLELLSLDNADAVPNVESFECPICFMEFNTGEGVILRDCLHTFCRECLAHTVQYSEDAEIMCPYMDNDYSCDSVLQEREVRALVSKDVYELHLVKSMRVAEHQIENAFHCKTPNCRGWCIYEDNVNQFKCPVCRITNCLTCRVIHDGLTCKQYQDRLASDCDSNADAKQTKDMLDQMVKNGEAMNCPTCQVIMMKKWGCDWLKCSMCKTEICWVTRGPRWGPGGKGDTSAGCKCGINNVKCHPKCNYCH